MTYVIFEFLLYLLFIFLLAPVLGSYMAMVLFEENNFKIFGIKKLEKLIYRLCSIDINMNMNWKQYAKYLLCFHFIGFLFLFFLQIYQQYLPLNPENLVNVSWPLAFNIAISFVTNTDWQSYSSENTLSYLVQTLGLCVQNFTSSACGLSVLCALIRGIKLNNSNNIGNFWIDLVRSILYILLPLSLIFSLILVSDGVIQNFSSYKKIETLQGDTQIIAMGPAASQIAIKQLGSNGGGFFAANSAHPLENPTVLSNFLQLLAILLIPVSSVYMFGRVMKSPKHASIILAVMMGVFISAFLAGIYFEEIPNKSIKTSLSLEGKELRFSRVSSVLWAIATTSSSNGSVNSSHDSLSPLTGGIALFLMMFGEIIIGGVGSGLYGMLLFVILTVFLSGLMIGKIPDYFGKKLSSFDMKMSIIGIILPGCIILVGVWLSCTIYSLGQSSINNNPHGFIDILYAWTSTANNNGSSFGGFNANNNFYHFGLAIAMIIGRFGIIIPVLALSQSLAAKNIVVSNNRFIIHTPVFGVLLIFVILLIGALTFFPCLILGPILEHLLMLEGLTF